MPDYGEILQFLADHPPELASERQLHASLLELLASCLRAEGDFGSHLSDQFVEQFATPASQEFRQ
ncbi:MAG: hypothetical protein R3D57_01615 [Hyphomicrobiaceae bacterium]